MLQNFQEVEIAKIRDNAGHVVKGTSKIAFIHSLTYIS